MVAADMPRKPSNILYSVNEKLPLGTLVILAIQHASLALLFLVYPLVAAAEAGMSFEDTQMLITSCIIFMALATLIECLPRAGAGLLLATFRFRLGRAVMGAASVWLAVMGFFYAGDPFTLAFCLGMALAMGLGARFLPTGLVDALNLFLAAFTALYVVFDLRDDLWNSAVRAQSDAAILASETWVPSIVWAALWTLLSLALLGVSAYWALHAKPPGGVKMPPMARARRV